jgi:hypothetical protein
MSAKGIGFRSSERSRIRHQAIQLAAQLPENPHLALRILEATKLIISDGLNDDRACEHAAARVVSLVR